MAAGLCLFGCASGPESSSPSQTAQTAASAEDTKADSANESSEAESAVNSTAQETKTPNSGVTVSVGSLKGPTSMGLVSLMQNNEAGNAGNQYEFQMVTAADELSALVAGEKVDIALVPANLAAVLYEKTEHAVSVIDINTLGVLYVVTGDSSVASISDLNGKTIYLTGKGTTPDYALQYVLEGNGLSNGDVTLEYKSESAEIAAILKEQPDAVGLLPQPFATVACAQNEALSPVLDLTEEWDKLQADDNGSRLVTGVTIVRNAFLEEYPDAVSTFMDEHEASSQYTNEHPEEAAALIADLGIVEQAAVAQKAIPACNITYIDGQEMKDALSGYLNVLFEQDPASVGGSLPDDSFYHILP